METETTTIHIQTPVNRICKYCGLPVLEHSPEAEWIIKGHGKYKTKEYFHKSCILNNWKKAQYDN